MDTKNIIAAISLSAAVIIIYGLFFAPDPQISNNKEKINNKNEVLQNSETPKLESKEEIIKISREDAIKENERISFENNNINLSIHEFIITEFTNSLGTHYLLLYGRYNDRDSAKKLCNYLESLIYFLQ